MNRDRLTLTIVMFGILVLFYLAWVVDGYSPQSSKVTSSEYTPEKVKDSELPELPELSDEEKAASDSLHKSYVKQAEKESQTKSVEKMRDEVYKILDEIVEEDSTISISFNMQMKSPWINETEEN